VHSAIPRPFREQKLCGMISPNITSAKVETSEPTKPVTESTSASSEPCSSERTGDVVPEVSEAIKIATIALTQVLPSSSVHSRKLPCYTPVAGGRSGAEVTSQNSGRLEYTLNSSSYFSDWNQCECIFSFHWIATAGHNLHTMNARMNGAKATRGEELCRVLRVRWSRAP
jgi:hypothetical protein